MTTAIKQEPSKSSANEKKKTGMAHSEEFNRIVQKMDESSSSAVANTNGEDAEMVSKAEYNKLKRKLEETEAEKQRDKKKLKTLRTFLATGVNFRPTRERISLVLPNCADLLTRNEFSLDSAPKEVAGFEFYLEAEKSAENPNTLGLYLSAYPPDNYKGPYELDVDFSIRVLNVFSANDIYLEENQKFRDSTLGEAWGDGQFAEIQKLLDQKEGFLQANGSIKVEVDFTVKTATLDHFLADDENGNSEEDGTGKN